jgi:hypothetical protein
VPGTCARRHQVTDDGDDQGDEDARDHERQGREPELRAQHPAKREGDEPKEDGAETPASPDRGGIGAVVTLVHQPAGHRRLDATEDSCRTRS